MLTFCHCTHFEDEHARAGACSAPECICDSFRFSHTLCDYCGTKIFTPDTEFCSELCKVKRELYSKLEAANKEKLELREKIEHLNNIRLLSEMQSVITLSQEIDEAKVATIKMVSQMTPDEIYRLKTRWTECISEINILIHKKTIKIETPLDKSKRLVAEAAETRKQMESPRECLNCEKSCKGKFCSDTCASQYKMIAGFLAMGFTKDAAKKMLGGITGVK